MKWENNFPRERWLMRCIVGFCCRYKVESCLLTFSTFWTKALYIQVGVTCHQGLLDRCHLQQTYFGSGVRCKLCMMHNAHCSSEHWFYMFQEVGSTSLWQHFKTKKCRIDMPHRKSSVPIVIIQKIIWFLPFLVFGSPLPSKRLFELTLNSIQWSSMASWEAIHPSFTVNWSWIELFELVENTHCDRLPGKGRVPYGAYPPPLSADVSSR